MGRWCLVVPETVRLTLEGEYLDVKAELTAGETRKVLTGMMRDQRFGEAPTADPERVGVTKIEQWVVGWSAVDPDKHPLPFSVDALLGLPWPAYLEIQAAVDAHAAKAEQAAEDRKKTQIGLPSSKATSASVN